MLSHPLPIIALVGYYPTNKLIGRRLIPRRNHTFRTKTLTSNTGIFPPLSRSRGQISTHYSPFRRFPPSEESFSRDLHA